jgi:hypothetical protein
VSITLGAIQKAAAEVIRLPVDFGDTPQLIAGASGGAPAALVLAVTIASYTVTCTGPAGTPPAVSAPQLDYPYQVSALFSGGTVGVYTATYTAVLSDPDGTTIVRTGQIEVV